MKQHLFFFFTFLFLSSNIITAQNISKTIEINNKAFGLYTEGKYEEAIAGFNNAIKIDSTNSLFYQNRALVYSALNNDSNAIKDYKTAIKLDTDATEVYYSLANIYQNKKKYSLANEYYTKAINVAIKNKETQNLHIYYFNRANNFLETEKYNEAISDYNLTEKANPDFNDLFLNRGIANYKINNIEKACLDWSTASKFDFPNAKKYFEENCENVDLKKYIKMPEFPGGISQLRRFISKNVNYPLKSINNGEQGTVFVRFRVKANGGIDDINVCSFTHKDLSIEAVKAILLTEGKWKPTSINKKNVGVYFSIPVTFRLDEVNNNILYKNIAYKFLEEKKYGKAKKKLHDYLLWHYDTTLIKDYIKIKYLLNDTADIEYYKYMIGKSNKKPDFLKQFSNTNDKKVKYFNTKPLNTNELKTFYYNNKYELSKRKDAVFYRKTIWNPNTLSFDSTFTDYNKNNKIIHTGSYKDGLKEGKFQIFYNDTNLLYAEGKYKKNKMSGLWKYYYKSNKLKDEIVIVGDEFKIINHYSEQGDTLVKIGTGKWSYKIVSYDGKNDMYVSGNLINGMKNGLWTIRNDKKLVVEEQYEKGKFIKGIYHKKIGKTKTSEPLITSWIFFNTPLERMGSLLISDKK